VAKDDLPNESMKTDKAMEFDSNKEISDKFLVIIYLLSVHGTFNVFPDMLMSFFHSVLEYPCPTILRDMCNATWHAIL
jgi:hypothetical protein